MSESDGLRDVSAVLADYFDRFGEWFPWPWGIGDLDEAEKIARECMERGKPYDFTYDDDKVY